MNRTARWIEARGLRVPAGRVRGPGILRVLGPLLVFSLAFAACAVSLREAKFAYAEGQAAEQNLDTARAVAAYKRARLEAADAVRRTPSAQAYALKGMAETALELWPEAKASFVNAFALGFAEGEDWAADVSLLGLARSFEETGLESAALRAYESLLGGGAFKPARQAAAARYVDLVLARALEGEGRERERALLDLRKTAEALIGRDFACGYFHYLYAQVSGHLGDSARGYEEAVAARELGLGAARVRRDNDLQIVYCYENRLEALPAAERDAFAARHAARATAWGWPDARTPEWKTR